MQSTFPNTIIINRKQVYSSMLAKDDFRRVYELLDEPPVPFDCGVLCNKICCKDWKDEVGIYLLPGEEQMFTFKEPWLKWEKHSTEDYEFCPDWQGEFYFARCIGNCDRARRPIQCRTFPLIPHLHPNGRLSIIFNYTYQDLCPLIAKNDYKLLNPQFIKNVELAWKILLNDPMIYSDVAYESELRLQTKKRYR